MEITVLDAENLPSRTYLSMRVGETRRQAPFQLNERFSFPAGTAKCLTFDLFEKLGSAQVSLAGLGEDLSTFSREHVEFDKKDGTKMKVDIKVELNNDGSGDPSTSKRSSRVSRHQAALRAKNYLDDYSVQNILQEMVQDLLAKQPADPLQYMCDFLQEKKKQTPAAKPQAEAARQDTASSRALPDFSKTEGLGEVDYPGFSPFLCPEVMPELDAHNSVLARVLQADPALYYKLRERRTPAGVSLGRCIKPGFDDARGSKEKVGVLSEPGIVAGDARCYDVFREVFDRVMQEWHSVCEWPRSQSLALAVGPVLDISPSLARSVEAIHVSARRCIDGLSFPPASSRDERKEVERVVSHALEELGGELAGTYYSLAAPSGRASRPMGSSREELDSLAKAGILMAPPYTTAKLSAGLGKHWPEARGVFVNDDHSLQVSLNEDDHMCMKVRATSLGSIVKAVHRLGRLHCSLEETLRLDGYSFAQSPRLGYLCTSPAHVGTGFTMTVGMRLPRLASSPTFPETCKRLRLQAIASSSTGIFDICNTVCLGSSVAEQVQMVLHGCSQLADMEADLQSGQPIATSAAVEEPGTGPGPSKVGAEDDPGPAPPGLGDEEYPGFPVDSCPEDMPDLSKHYSLMAGALKKDPGLFSRLRSKTTANGVTFAKVIKPGVDNRGHAMIRTAGLVAGDDACYETFGELFDSILLLRPGGHVCSSHLTDMDVAKVHSGEIDASGKYVLEVQIRMSRNIKGILFPPAITFLERREAERVLTKALLSLKGDFAGRYYPLRSSSSFIPMPLGMSEAEEHTLNEDGILFVAPDSQFVLSSGMGRHWPDARGVFATPSRDVYAWINEEEHFKLTAQLPGSNFQQVFANLCTVEQAVQSVLADEGHDFAHSSSRGFLTTCPTNAGTGLRVSAVLHLPSVAAKAGFRDQCKRLGLQVRNVGSVAGTMYEVSNIQRLGSSEVEQVNSVIAGVQQLIKLEVAEESAIVDVPLAQDASAMRAVHSLLPGDTPGDAHLPVLGDDHPKEIPPAEPLNEEEASEHDGEAYEGFPREFCPENMPDLSCNYTVMAEILRTDVTLYSRLREKRTQLGVPFAQVVKPGMDLEGHPMVRSLGVVAGDAECFSTFRELLDPVLREGLHLEPSGPHITDMDPSKVGGISDAYKMRVHSIRLEASRNLQAFRFPSSCSKDERRETEHVVAAALGDLDGLAEGIYSSLAAGPESAPGAACASPASRASLRKSGLLLQEPDSAALLSMGFGRDWPDARGMFVSRDSRTVAWVNGEDHLQLHFTRKDADVQSIFASFCRVHGAIESHLQQRGHTFAYSPELGFLGSNLANLGTGMRVCLVVSLRRLAAEPYFRETCRHLGLLVRPIPGPFGAQADRHEVSNIDRLGYSEVDVVNATVAGTQTLLEMEDALEKGVKVPRPGLGSASLGAFASSEADPEQLPNLAGQQNLVAKVLQDTPGMYSSLRMVRTELGNSFAQVIKPGMDARRRLIPRGIEDGIGMVAGDSSSCQAFAQAFNPAIEAWHGLPIPDAHPVGDTSSSQATCSKLPVEYTVRTKVTLSRSIAGLRFSPCCSQEERREVERVLASALETLSGDLEGEYFPLSGSTSFSGKMGGMSADDERRLRKAGFLFREPEATRLLCAGVGREWPDARGVFVDQKDRLAAWVNAEEHLMLSGVQDGSEVQAAFDMVYSAERALDTTLRQDGYRFAWSNRHGYLTALPERLGTGLTVSVTLKLPKLAGSQLPQVSGLGKPILRRGRQGIVEVVNSTTFGVSSVDILESVAAAAAKLVAAEVAAT